MDFNPFALELHQEKMKHFEVALSGRQSHMAWYSPIQFLLFEGMGGHPTKHLKSIVHFQLAHIRLEQKHHKK